ncbi:hypothetical protein LB507_005420 [Fusarium sp. FIESC RH6]|nr:hypothetical protein LB507_005420 [Fusarium sp. FIESC RH6]
MKFNLSTLQVLALCQFVAASPCKPAGSSVTADSITTERSITTDSVTLSETSLQLSSTVTDVVTATTDSVVTFETATASQSATTFKAITSSDTETLLTDSVTSSEYVTTLAGGTDPEVTTTSETELETTTSGLVAISESTITSDGIAASGGSSGLETTTTSEAAATSQATIITSSEPESEGVATESIITAEATTTSELPIISTTSAEPTTTTSTLPERPTNLLLNPGFEDSTISPWLRWNNIGTLSLSTTQLRTGSQSGFMTARSSAGNPANYGFVQDIDVSLLEAGKPYEFSVYSKSTLRSTCGNRVIGCLRNGNSLFNYVSYGPEDADWDLMKITCVWTQAQLDSGPRVGVIRQCRSMDWYIDDAMLIEAA